MKRLLVAVLLVVGTAPAAPVEAQSLVSTFKRVNPSVVIIRARWKEVGGSGQVGRVNEVGSGVLVSPDGKVMTASHVVQTADEITAEFLGGEVVPARVIASEPEADVSLLQLERVPAKATVARFGNSDRAEVGDQVFIIGAPYGIAHTLSVGYVTGRHKPNTVYSELALAEFFQTDAAINPGNSGGPMFNMAGEVIGIASHNITKSGGSEGLGFVVTVNMARRLLLEQRSFWSGMSGVVVGGQVARALNLPQPVGLMVQQVAADSPAARMGLRPGVIPATIEGKAFLLGGDIIMAVQERELGSETYEALQARLRSLPSGSIISVIILREGRSVTLSGVKD
ncbi:MAG TPA: trypsin-like peptidase domain-containing protein [Verrucomicrobiae bacterium]|jgi:serine protease Do|nr:trypsin-like peptidase domain-containing protein [Verrucomicrobiae bacterium]